VARLGAVLVASGLLIGLVAMGGCDSEESSSPPATPSGDTGQPGGGTEPSQVYVVGRDGKGLRKLTDDERSRMGAAWSPDGRAIAVLAGTVEGSSVRMTTLEVLPADGGRTRRFELGDVQSFPEWSRDGREVTVVQGLGDRRVVAVDVGSDASTRPRVLGGAMPPGTAEGLSWSPDGKTLAYPSVHEEWCPPNQRCVPPGSRDRGSPRNPVVPLLPQADISLVRRDGSERRRLTRTTSEQELAPQWSPDGRRILFARKPISYEPGSPRTGLWIVDPEGREERRLVDYDQPTFQVWSPDGRSVAVGLIGGPAGHGLRVISVRGGKPRTLARFTNGRLAWSPDGELIAHSVGRVGIEAVAPDGGDRRMLVRMRGRRIESLKWSPDGSRLAFTAGVPPPSRD
jgi:Tol biopolymer transport system component